MSEWQPIATAPKDGSMILLGKPAMDDMDAICAPGYWWEQEGDMPDSMGHDGGFMDVECDVFVPGRSFGNPKYQHVGNQPTHWMPLPPPPGDAA